MHRTFALVSLALATALGAGDYANEATNNELGPGKPAMLRTQGARHQTAPFSGVKANTGYAVHFTENGKGMLMVSDDFVIPDAPAPSWQIVDSRGNVYLLNQMKIKDGTNRRIVVPGYIRDIAKVQCWCSFAEVLLGEAFFDRPVRN